MLEQIAEERNAAEQRHLRDSYAVLGLYYAANHHRPTVRDQHLRGRLLRVERGVQLRTGYTAEIRRRVLHVHIQEDSIVCRNLRYHGYTQESFHICDRGRAAQLGLRHDWNA